jgi:hypothetical protein
MDQPVAPAKPAPEPPKVPSRWLCLVLFAIGVGLLAATWFQLRSEGKFYLLALVIPPLAFVVGGVGLFEPRVMNPTWLKWYPPGEGQGYKVLAYTTYTAGWVLGLALALAVQLGWLRLA